MGKVDAFHMGVKERAWVPALILLSPPVGFGFWLLPSCHSFGLRTGEVKLLFWFDLGEGGSESSHISQSFWATCMFDFGCGLWRGDPHTRTGGQW